MEHQGAEGGARQLLEPRGAGRHPGLPAGRHELGSQRSALNSESRIIYRLVVYTRTNLRSYNCMAVCAHFMSGEMPGRTNVRVP